MLTETADRNSSKIPSYPDYFRCPAEGRGSPTTMGAPLIDMALEIRINC